MRFGRLFVFASLGAAVSANACGSDDEGGSGDGTDVDAAAGTGGSGGSGGSGGTSGGSGGTAGTAGTAATGGSGATTTGGSGGITIEPDARSPEETGSACMAASDCFNNIDAGALQGEPVCLTEVEDGYCTHTCETDDDCCAVEGECQTDFKQVCASFQARGEKFCFLSCEDEDIVDFIDGGLPLDAGADAGPPEEAIEFCAAEAHPSFVCRSTGGGVENRRACIPEGAPVDGGPPVDGGGGPPDGAGPPTGDGGGMPDASMDGAMPDAAMDASMDASMDGSDAG